MRSMTKKDGTPQIRFKGFTDAWEQRKLGDIFKYEQPQAYIVESTEYDDRFQIPVLTAGQSFVLGYTDEDFGIKNANPRNPVVIFDDFTTSSHYVDFPFKIKSSAMKLLSLVNGKDDIHCAYNVLQNIEYEPVSHERHWISTFAKFNVYMPQNSAEQKCIGDYFANLDHLITLHQRKYDKLLNVKKSMLEKMFPKNGSDVPEIRFKGFTDAWEQRKAIDIADYSKGNGYSKGDLIDAGTPIILYGRLYTKYQFAISEVDTFAVPRNGAVYSQGNEVIVPASGETAEDIARASAVEKSGVLLGGDLNILRPFDFINPLFLALAISNGEPQRELAKKAQGKSVVHIHNTDIQEMTIAYPSKTEQDRMVSVFRRLDHLITLHQRKLEKLQNIKKSMLEKMFV